ncbi:arginase [Clonorchis sinensis]|uniref:Arginase n=1 Tax=Clonorchis sinensis TaxID=79923 RepID=G7YVE9_CLOSI|nr:arginase [Clonorchis sinensis]
MGAHSSTNASTLSETEAKEESTPTALTSVYPPNLVHGEKFQWVDFDNPLLRRDCPLPLYPQVNMIGAPVHKGQPKNGTQYGPSLIRNSDIVEFLKTIGVTLVDHGDVAIKNDDLVEPKVFSMVNCYSFIESTCTIAKRVEELLKESNSGVNGKHQRDSPLLVVGGDHSIATGTILGHKRVKPDACVIWIDAHADLNTPLTSSSGNMHGMPVAFLMEELQEEVPYMKEMDPIEPCLKAREIAYIALRDLDPHEVYDLRKNNITHFTMVDIDRMGIEWVINKAIEAVNPRLEKPIHLSFDIDAMDPTLAPSTGTTVPGGLTIREALRICETVHSTGKLSVMDLAELNPKIGSQADVDRTKHTAITLLKACFGYRRSGHLPFKVHSLSDHGIVSRADQQASCQTQCI